MINRFEKYLHQINIFAFITYLYKEHIRKNLELYISLRLHYSLVFDLSPTLRQIASIQLFYVTRNAKQFSFFYETMAPKQSENLYLIICVNIPYLEHYRSIVISLLISYAVINSPSGAMDMVLAC